MPQVTECNFLISPSAGISGPIGGTYAARYRAKTNGILSGLGVLVSAQSAAPDPIPVYGAIYSVNIGGSNETDQNSFARQFSATQETPEKKTNWLIDVSWIPLDNSASGGNAGGLANAVFPTDLSRPPLNWEPRDWMEWESTIQQLAQARNVQSFRNRAAHELGPIINSAGSTILHEVELPRRIYVVQRNVNDWRVADEFNRDFTLTINQTTWRGFAAGTARYLRSETSQPQFHDDQAYFVMQSRWEINDAGHARRYPNVGVTAFLNVNRANHDKAARLTKDSFAIDEPAPLDFDGRFAEALAAPNPVPKVASAPLPFIDYDFLTNATYDAIIA